MNINLTIVQQKHRCMYLHIADLCVDDSEITSPTIAV